MLHLLNSQIFWRNILLIIYYFCLAGVSLYWCTLMPTWLRVGIHFAWYLETELKVMQQIIFLVKQDHSFSSLLFKDSGDKDFVPFPFFTACWCHCFKVIQKVILPPLCFIFSFSSYTWVLFLIHNQLLFSTKQCLKQAWWGLSQ